MITNILDGGFSDDLELLGCGCGCGCGGRSTDYHNGLNDGCKDEITAIP